MYTMNWNDRGLLCLSRDGVVTRTFTYSDFEKYCCEAITPSMYHYMASYVMQNRDESNAEMAAVNSYFNIPTDVRIDMHDQELMNLNWQRERINIMLDTVSDDYEIHGLMEDLAHFSKEILEEELWYI